MQSRFVVTGNGGLPQTPDNQEIQYSLTKPQAVISIKYSQTSTAKPEWKLGDKVQEATQLVKTSDGCLILASSNTNPTSSQNLTCN